MVCDILAKNLASVVTFGKTIGKSDLNKIIRSDLNIDPIDL